MFKSVIIAGIGGFIGTILRFLVSKYFQLNYTTVFPWGTFLVNFTGCLLIGIVAGIAEKGDFLTSEWRLFLVVGFCGGYTTFSSFSNDAFLLLQDRELMRFTLYTVLSVVLGILAVIVGRNIIKVIQ